MYIPLNYDKININTGTYNPNSIKSRNNRSFDFWERALFQRACSVLEFEFPKEWDGTTRDFIIYSLFKYGYGVVANNNEFGTFFQPCTLGGYDFYYQPTYAIVSNPLLSETYQIGAECEIMKLTPDYMGIWDIITYYAEKLSGMDNAINMSIVNSKYAYILGAKTKSAAQSIKKIMDLVNKGEPTVVYDQRIVDDATTNTEPWQYLDLGVEKHYLLDRQLQDFSTILNNFDLEIGIPTLPYEKKERLVTSEADSRKLESVARATVWVETLNNSFTKINEMFNTNMSVKLRFEEEVSDNVIE